MLYLEKPEDKRIHGGIVVLEGWYTTEDAGVNPRLLLGDHPLHHTTCRRSDVEEAFPGKVAAGFQATFHVSEVLPWIKDGIVSLALVVEGEHPQTEPIQVTAGARITAAATRYAQGQKRFWLRDRLRCPLCRTGGPLRLGHEEVVCAGCGASFPQTTRAINMIGGGMQARFALKETENVSMHEYDSFSQAFVEEVRLRGGMVLDCGAGIRERSHPNVGPMSCFQTRISLVNQRRIC